MGYVLTRPAPTTNPPDSWGRIQNINCCSHCGSGIDAENKCCERCGAPNENYKQVVVEKQETWGERIREIENIEPVEWGSTHDKNTYEYLQKKFNSDLASFVSDMKRTAFTQ